MTSKKTPTWLTVLLRLRLLPAVPTLPVRRHQPSDVLISVNDGDDVPLLGLGEDGPDQDGQPAVAPATLTPPKELPYKSLTLLARIGGGAFGDVFEGMLERAENTCFCGQGGCESPKT